MTNASDTFFSAGQGLLYPLNSEAQWVGRWRGGEIVSEPHAEQERDINTREPLFWDPARTQPKMQLVFDVVCNGTGPAAQYGLPTDERVDAQDDGRRTVYVKGKDKREAIAGQLKDHKRPGLRIGDHYYECWTGNRQGKLGQARTWAAKLFPGAGQAQQAFFGNEQQHAVPQPAAPGPIANTPVQVAGAWGATPAGPAPHPGPPPQFGGQPAAPPVQQPQYAQAALPVDWSPPAEPSAPPVPGRQDWGSALRSAPTPPAPPAASGGWPGPGGVPAAVTQAPPADPWGAAPPAANPYAG